MKRTTQSWTTENDEELVRIYENLLKDEKYHRNRKEAFADVGNMIGRSYSSVRIRYYKLKSIKPDDVLVDNMESVEEAKQIVENSQPNLLDTIKSYTETILSIVKGEYEEQIDSILKEKYILEQEINTVLKYIKMASTESTLREIGMTDRSTYRMEKNGNLERV